MKDKVKKPTIKNPKVKKVKVKKIKKKTTSQLKKELDRLFSIHIRKKYADTNGYTACVTCGARKPWQEQQNGHYESRLHLSLRYSEDNCFPQCVGCNVFRGGNYTSYSLFLINKFGKEHLEMLARKKNEITKYFPYEEMIEKYKEI